MDWANMRLEQSVMDMLGEYRLRLYQNVQRSPKRYPLWLREGRVSLGDAIRFLVHERSLKWDRAHRHRVKRYLEGLDARVEAIRTAVEEGIAVVRANGESVPDAASVPDSSADAGQQGS